MAAHQSDRRAEAGWIEGEVPPGHREKELHGERPRHRYTFSCPGQCGRQVQACWNDVGDPVPCDSCAEVRVLQRRQEALDKARDRSRIPICFQGYRLDHLSERRASEPINAFVARIEEMEKVIGVSRYNQHIVLELRSWLSSRSPRRSIWLKGPRGNGKTLLLCALLQHLLEAGEDVLVLSELELFGQSSAERHLAEIQGGVLYEAKTCRVLMLDGVSATQHRADPPKPWMVRALMGLITTRYNANLPILCSSSSSLLEYATVWRFGPSDEDTGLGLAGRLYQMCGRREIEMLGWDWRTGEQYEEDP